MDCWSWLSRLVVTPECYAISNKICELWFVKSLKRTEILMTTTTQPSMHKEGVSWLSRLVQKTNSAVKGVLEKLFVQQTRTYDATAML